MNRYAIMPFADAQADNPPAHRRDGWQVIDTQQQESGHARIMDRYRGPSAMQAAMIAMQAREEAGQRGHHYGRTTNYC